MSEILVEKVCEKCGLAYIGECICNKTHANKGIIGKDTAFNESIRKKLYRKRMND